MLLHAVITGCSDPKLEDKQREIQARKIANRLDSNSIKVFREWNYFQRGEAGIWSRISNDSVYYNCLYRTDKDTVKLNIYIGEPNKFEKDFPTNYILDITKYQRFNISKYDQTIRIIGVDTVGRGHLLTDSLRFKDVFKSANLFNKLGALNKLRDSLGFYKVTYIKRLGNFIEFSLSARYIFTYLPDDLNLDPQVKNIWLSEFATGKMIQKYWNLRKLRVQGEN